MKVNQLLTTCGIAAALMLSAGTVSAQNDNGSPSGRPGGSGRGNFDPAQFQQRMMDNIKEQLGYTNDTDWNAVQPLIQKVMDARRDVGFGGGMGRMFGRNRGGNNGDNANGGVRRGGSLGGQPSPEAEALQKAIDDNSPAARPRKKPNRPNWNRRRPASAKCSRSNRKRKPLCWDCSSNESKHTREKLTFEHERNRHPGFTVEAVA
jgi:hypothetical protein